MSKIYSIDGKIVEPLNANEVYLAIWKKDNCWHVSGVMYRNIDDIQANLQNFNPEKILIIKVKIPEGD